MAYAAGSNPVALGIASSSLALRTNNGDCSVMGAWLAVNQSDRDRNPLSPQIYLRQSRGIASPTTDNEWFDSRCAGAVVILSATVA